MTDDLKKVEARLAEIEKKNAATQAYYQKTHAEHLARQKLELSEAAANLPRLKARLVEFKRGIAGRTPIQIKESLSEIDVYIGARFGWVQKPLFAFAIKVRNGEFDITDRSYATGAGDKIISRSGIDLEAVMDTIAETTAESISAGKRSFQLSKQGKDAYIFGIWGTAFIFSILQGVFDVFGHTETFSENIKMLFWLGVASLLWPLVLVAVVGIIVLSILK